jgi:polyhydroxyalkanoate synthesis regulator phasin
MLDMMKKALMAGIGLALKTKDEVEEIARELIQKGKMSEKDGKKFLDDLMARYESARSNIDTWVENAVQNLIKKGKLATRDEIEGLRKEVQDLKNSMSAKNEDKP